MTSHVEANGGHPRVRALVAAVLVLAGLAGCGSAPVDELPPAATVAAAPARAATPQGELVAVGGRVAGLAFDAVSGQLAVAVDGPPRLLLLDPATGAPRRTVALPAAPGRPVADGRGDVLVPVATQAGVVRVDARSGRLDAAATGAMRAEGGHLTAEPETTPAPPPAAVAPATTTPAPPPGTGPTGPTGDAVAVLDGAGRGLGLRGAAGTLGSTPTDLGASDLLAADAGRKLAVLAGRARTLAVFDATDGLKRLGRVDVGVGPAGLASAADYVFVTDSEGDALLVVRVRPHVDLERRLTLEGRPWAITLDPVRRALWVTLPATNEVVELPATRRPHILRRFPTVARPAAVAVDPASGRVYVAGEGGRSVQLLLP